MSMIQDVSFIPLSQSVAAFISVFVVRIHSVCDFGVGVGAGGVAGSTTPVSFHDRMPHLQPLPTSHN
jgi:hypothetical protein